MIIIHTSNGRKNILVRFWSFFSANYVYRVYSSAFSQGTLGWPSLGTSCWPRWISRSSSRLAEVVELVAVLFGQLVAAPPRDLDGFGGFQAATYRQSRRAQPRVGPSPRRYQPESLSAWMSGNRSTKPDAAGTRFHMTSCL